MVALTLLIGLVAVVVPAMAQTLPEGGVPSLPADRYERQPALDVLHYEIGIEIPLEGRSVAGRTTVLYRTVMGLEQVRLDFGAAMNVDSVSIDGTRARSSAKAIGS